MKLLLSAAAIVWASAALGAQMAFMPDGRMNVAAIRQCADKPFPAQVVVDVQAGIDEFRRQLAANRSAEYSFQQIMQCRLMLQARHAGWVDADPGKLDPVPQVEMSRADDFR